MLALILFLALPSQLLGVQTIQPRTLTSPSGEWTLRTDPSSKFGDGPSHVAVSHGTETVWTTDLAITFWDAQVSDKGVVAGYAFTAGSTAKWNALGDLVVAIFAPDGRELLHESVPRTTSRFLHSRPDPDPCGLFVQPVVDRFVLRVEDADLNRGNEEWWTYSLSTGEALGHVLPRDLMGPAEGIRSPIDAKPIAGTPLTLVQWYQVPGWPRVQEPGTRFVLVGEDWRPVWTLERAREYCNANEDLADELCKEAWKDGGILAADASQRFEVRHVAANERVTYEVTADSAAADGWTVREVSRAPYIKPATPELRTLALQKLATVPLQADGPRVAGPVRDLVAFDFEAAGRVACVRGEESGVTLLLLDDAGAVEQEVPLDAIAPGVEGRRAWHALGDGRWLYTLSPFGPHVHSRAWFVDAASGAAAEIERFAGPSIEAVRPTPAGGFVVLGQFWQKYSSSEALIAFDRNGARSWEHITDGYRGEPDELMGTEDLAVESDGSVLVLDNVRKAVQVFAADGRYERTVELSADGKPLNYQTALRVEPSGHWLVSDFRLTEGLAGRYRWHRIDREGRSVASFELQREDGSTEIGSSDSVRIDFGGRLWTTDGQALYVLDDDGVLRPRFGASPDAERLDEPIAVDFDDRGHIAVADRRSHAVHVFGPSGVRERVLHPDAKDFDQPLFLMSSHSAPDGRVYVRVDNSADRYLGFAADGHRLGWTELGGARVAFTPDGGRWVAEGRSWEASSLRRFGPLGEAGPTILRRPNHDFYLSIDALSCGPDGALFVLTGADEGALEVDRFTSAGQPVETVSLHDSPGTYWSRLSHAGRWLVASSFTNEAVLIDLDGGRPGLVRVDEGTKDKSCAFALSPDGTELWCATVEPLALHRFALPDAR